MHRSRNAHPSRIRLEFTTVLEKIPEGYIAFIEELPGDVMPLNYRLTASA